MDKCALLVTIVLLCFFSKSNAQPWMYTDEGTEITDFSEMQKRAEILFSGKENIKGAGYKPYKRWEYFWKSRLMSDGQLPTADFIEKERQKYFAKHPVSTESRMSNWNSIGPENMPFGIGRVNCITFHPTDPNTLWLGTPSGGIWKSTDAGNSWNILSDDLPSMGVSGIAVHPTSPNIIYIATGDGEIRDSPSVGVLKSTDGGLTWQKTGLDWSSTQSWTIRRLIMDPNNPNVLLIASTNGIYRTEDAGVNWTFVRSGRAHDIEYKPNAVGVLYAGVANGSGYIVKSTDNGLTWSNLETFTGANRISIAVTPANPDYVYAVVTATSTYTLKGVYRSTDSGTNWNLRNTTVNIGAQSYYNLILQGHPTNAEELWIGGVGTFRSTNGGQDFQSAGTGLHVDAHAMEWKPDGTYYQGNDGGIYIKTSTQSTWTNISDGLVIGQMYRLGLSPTDTKILAGHQDNGTTKFESSSWEKEYGGDGMECFFDPNNSSTFYISTQNGGIRRTVNNGQNFSFIRPSGESNGNWVTPFIAHKTSNANHRIYTAFKDVYSSDNQGDSWNKLSDFQSSILLDYLAVAPSNPNYIYTGRGNSALRKTTDGGVTWTTVVKPSGTVKMLVTHPTDPKKIWIVMGFYSSGQKVFQSDNGGYSWTNISGSLPNVPYNCLTVQEDTNDGIYIGSDIGVFYKDGNMSDWMAFDTGLPNMPVRELEIDYSEGKIYAATYGRGMWKSDLYSMPSNSLNVNPLSLSVSSVAQVKQVSITSNVTWSISKPNWVTINPLNGLNDETITVNFLENNNTSARSGQILISGGGLSKAVSLSQAGKIISGNCSNNLLQNYGYENGLVSWSGGGELSSQSYTGGSALKTCTYLTPARQTIAIQGDTNFEVKVHAKRDAGTTGVVAIKFMNSSWYPITTEFFPITSLNYALISESIIAPNDAVWVEVSVLQDGGTGCVYVDDWCLEETIISNPCSVTASALNVSCDNNGTLDITADDEFSFAIFAEGENTSTGWATTINGMTVNGSYNQPKLVGPFLISDGNISIIVRDQNSNTCSDALTIIAPATCSNGSTPACQNNLIVNGSFSQNEANWNEIGTPFTVSYVTDNQSFSGTSLQLCNVNDRIYQTVQIQANRNYTMACQAKRSSGAEGVLAVKYLDANWIPLETKFQGVTDNIYTYTSLTALAPATSKYAEISYLHGGGPGCVWADDICFIGDGNTGTQADLITENINISTNTIQKGQVLSFNFDLKNVGNGLADGSFSIKSYLSTDQALSSDDVQDGIIPTGFVAAGQSIIQTPGALTVPNSLPNGTYYVLVEVDADNQIPEQNEFNNVTASLGQITVTDVPVTNKPDIELSISAEPQSPGQFANVVLLFSVTNNGTKNAQGIVVQMPAQSTAAFRDVLSYVSHSSGNGTSLNSWSGRWVIASLTAGETKTLTYNAYSKTSNAIRIFTQVVAQSPTDFDSSPNNNSTDIPVEDDEALLIINDAQPLIQGEKIEEISKEPASNKIAFPNPASTFCKVDLSAYENKKVDIRLVNVYGVLVQKEVLISRDEYYLNLENIKNGAYFLYLHSEDKRPVVEQIIVEKGL